MSDILLFHEMHKDMQIPQEPILTFDDGLYTQYKFGKDLPNKRKIFFISTKFICTENQSTEFIHCRDAHQKAFAGNYENYMTLDQILELLESGCEIGGHSHAHAHPKYFKTLREATEHLVKDTELMAGWFNKNLGFIPPTFSYPHHREVRGVYKAILMKHGFREFFGRGRLKLDGTPA